MGECQRTESIVQENLEYYLDKVREYVGVKNYDAAILCIKLMERFLTHTKIADERQGFL